MSRAGDVRARWFGRGHSVPTMVSKRDLDVLAKQIGQLVTLATALAARLRGPTIKEPATRPGHQQRLGHLDWAILAGQAALTQLDLSLHQPPSRTQHTAPTVPLGVRS